MNGQKVVAELTSELNGTLSNLAGLLARIGVVQAELDRLQQDMYEEVPTVLWEDREGKGRYMRLQFALDRETGKRARVYVGADPQKIADAKRKIANRETWGQLRAERDRMQATAQRLERALREGIDQGIRVRQQYLPTSPNEPLATGTVLQAALPLPAMPAMLKLPDMMPDGQPATARVIAVTVVDTALGTLLDRADRRFSSLAAALVPLVESGVRRSLIAGAIVELVAPEEWRQTAGYLVSPANLDYETVHRELQQALGRLLVIG